MRTNIHTHLFSADHTPSAQLYYLFRGAFHSAARKLLPKVLGRAVTLDDLANLDRSLDAFGPPWNTLFGLVLLESNFSSGASLIDPGLLISMFMVMSRIPRLDAERIMGVDNFEKEEDLLKSLLSRINDKKKANDQYPFRSALCDIVRELFDVHTQGVKTCGKPVTHEDVWNSFVSSPGGDNYDRIIVLSVNFDEAFKSEMLPGLNNSASLDFSKQTADLEALAAKVNAEGGTQIIPFLCIEPRNQNASKLLTFVQTHVGKTKPWKGLKFYPPMGLLPFDERLNGVFDFCQDYSIPVITHCSIGGSGVRGPDHNCADLAHPMKWSQVLVRLENRFKTGKSTGTFKLDLAHFDRLENDMKDSWSADIMSLMTLYNGKNGVKVYTDISCNVITSDESRNQYADNVKVVLQAGLGKQILFGTDFHCCLYECSDETAYIKQLNIDNGWWQSTDLENSADDFLNDVL